MTVEYNKNSYASSKGFLAFPDHYVAVGQLFEKDHSLAVVDAVTGRKIIKAGTPYPSNDANAVGLVFSDLDVTNGDQTGAVLIHGFVATAKLPVAIAATAKAAMKGVQFLPVVSPGAVTITADPVDIAEGAAKDTTATVQVALANATFRPEASVKTNWTFVGEAAAKVAVDSIAVAADGTYVTMTLKATDVAVAGDITAVPKLAAISLAVAPAQAITIATVA